MVEAKRHSGGEGLSFLMVGGGPGAFIGAVHKAAVDLLGRARLVGGCFSQSFDKSKAQGKLWSIAPDRVYPTYAQMLTQEAARPDRPDFVTIVTPNNTHYPVAKMALEKGFHVVCDKPLCLTVKEASDLVATARQKRLEFLVTYTYVGYPMVRQAREMVKRGDLGDLRLVIAEYAQDWLADQPKDNKQAGWRTDPKVSGLAGCMGDIGTHAESLASFITDLSPVSLLANLDTFVKGRKLDDNGFVWLKYPRGIKGSIWASQVAVGKENGLTIRLFGTKGGLEWQQENPNLLYFMPKGKPVELLTRAQGYLHPHAGRYTRLPTGHPEGLFEAFANLYDGFISTIIAKRKGTKPSDFDLFPNVGDGARGVKFIHALIKSNKNKNTWVTLDK
ncbi:MAG: Gfo/Idh/MocA family oxidoreductase [Planctomycetota bacterium]|jgi:predicted dehydrogenase|nr:Gfo/Idh/MocA family oxidoreductase [Planctomycetota bacterium]